MPKVIYLQISSLDAAIKSAAGDLKFLVAPKGVSFKLEVEIDGKILDKVNKDLLVNQEMRDAAQKVADKMVANIGEILKSSDRAAVKLVDAGRLQDAKSLGPLVTQAIEKEKKQAITDGEKRAMEVWKKLQTTRKDYRNYKIKAGINIFSGIAGVAASLTLALTVGFSGPAGAFLAVAGMARNAVKIVSQIASLMESVEKAATDLVNDIRALQQVGVKAKTDAITKFNEQYKKDHGVEPPADLAEDVLKDFKAGAADLKAREYAMTALKGFTGYAGKSVSRCAENYKVVLNKIKGLVVASHDAAIELEKALKACEQVKMKFMQSVQQSLSKNPASQSKKQEQAELIEKQLNAVLAPFEESVSDLFQKISSLRSRVAAAEHATNGLTNELNALRGTVGKGPQALGMAISAGLICADFLSEGTAFLKNAHELADHVKDFATQDISQEAADFTIEKVSHKVFKDTLLEKK